MKWLILSIIFLTGRSSFSQVPEKAEVVTINGSKIYYEKYGKGEPLFLLHGYTLSSTSWHSYISDYVKDFQVYVIDLKGHGKSSPFSEKLSLKTVARDVDALINYLKLESIKAIGYSYGGDVLYQLALIHPGIISSMITIGSCGSWDVNNFPDWLEQFSYKKISNLKWIREHQTDEAQVQSILDQFPNYTVVITNEEYKKIKNPTLIVLGDKDNSIPLDCVSSARKNMPDSYLWIIPNAEHGAHEGKSKNEFVRVSKEFFSNSWTK